MKKLPTNELKQRVYELKEMYLHLKKYYGEKVANEYHEKEFKKIYPDIL
jgi:hypothetical protein